MEDENEYKKLPTEEKCVHKLWKARLAGYEEAIKLFNQIDDEKSPEWNKYLGLIKKFVTDSNAVAQERGLEAALVFVENCGHAGKTTGEVMSGIVTKCIAAPKTKTKDLALQVTLMYVEIEKHETVQEELMKGMEQKNPKVVAACTAALTSALKQFGNKVIGIKPMVKKIPVLLTDRDKGVRDEMKALVIEMHRWIGAAIEPHISSLQAVVQQELRDSFSSGGAQPTRYLRSQQNRIRDAPSDDVDGAADDDDAETGAGDSNEMDPYDLLDPVEILSKLPKDFYTKLEATKWQERKEALDALEALLKTAPKLEPGDYADLVRALKKVISKDTNVMLVALGGRLMGMVANGLRSKFQPYAVACVQAILEKFKEKKTNVVLALREAIDAIYPCTNLEAIMEDMLAAFENKNPSIKAESATFLARALCRTQPSAFNKKLIKAYVAGLLKLLESADPVVRDAAAEALGTATKLVGEKNIAPHIGKIDNLKEQKIKEFADKAVIQVKVAAPKKEAKAKTTATAKGDTKTAGSAQPKPVKRPPVAKTEDSDRHTTPTKQSGKVSKSASKASMRDEDDAFEDAEEHEGAPVDDNRPKTDIAPLITDALVAEINDKNWKIRNEALDKLKVLISNAAPIKPSLGELPPALTARLLDSNSKLAQSALQICELLATAMGARCKQHARTFFPAFFQAFGDNKQWIRTAAISCVETWCRCAGPQAPLEGEMLHDALKAGSPVLRSTLLLWLTQHLPTVPQKSYPREELTICVPILYACLEDRVADVRKAAADCVLPFMLQLGYDSMFKQMDKLKPGSKTVIQAALDKARPNLPVQPLPAKAKKEEPRGVKSAGALKKEAEKNAPSVKGKVPVKPASASSRNKKDDEDFSPLLPNNNAKNQRIIDDQKLKVLKWNFTTPRTEFIDLLKEQMTNAGLNKQLIANMFHSDFRYHLKAIEALSDDLVDNGLALMANLDLVLKWLTLRFFDTNPSVILKGLEYLSVVFQYLMDSDYTMAEYEANCFLPYLVQKVGDPKDTVRNAVKLLFKQICVVYSVTKLFGYLMEGLKSKNARQRAECLECIGHLLEMYGSTVMSPSASTALKELARHIGDRDNAVRSAALNCVANAYFLEGEKVYKMIGQISDKDLSLLEERIKRASKSRSAELRRSLVVPLTAAGKPIQVPPEDIEPRRVISVDTTPAADYEEEEEEEEEEPPPPQANLAPVEPRVATGPFGLDPVLIAELDAAVPVVARPQLPQLDLNFLDEPVPRPQVHRSHTTRTSIVPPSPPRSYSVLPSAQTTQNTQSTVDDSQLADTIHSIASPDIHAAIRALSLISGALVSGRGAAFASHESRLLSAIAAQLRRLRTASPGPAAPDTLPAYKYLAGALSTFYESGGCGAHVSEAALCALLAELLRVLAAAPAQPERLVRVLNNVCVSVLEHSPHSLLLCSIVSLLHESIGVSDPAFPRYQDLLLKCFWKILKMIPSWDSNSIDYDAVLLKIHDFYKAYPNSYWKKNADISDTPYRTVKTLVHTLVKMKGASIVNHLTQISDVNESDLYPYLLKVIKQLKLDDKKENAPDVVNNGTVIASVTPNNALTANRLPRGVHDELALILKRIGSKEHSKDALSQLYDLRERHPEVDIWTFMHGSSFYFRNYVERGLREVADQRKMGNVALFKHDFKTDNIDINNENDEKSHVVFLERLRALQAKAGMKTDSAPSSQPRTPATDNRTLVDSINENTLTRTHSIDPQLELHTTQPVSHKNEAAVDVLRLKLQQIKSSSKR